MNTQSSAFDATSLLQYLTGGDISDNTPIMCQAYDANGHNIIFARSSTTSGLVFTIWDSSNTTLTLSSFSAVADLINQFN